MDPQWSLHSIVTLIQLFTTLVKSEVLIHVLNSSIMVVAMETLALTGASTIM